METVSTNRQRHLGIRGQGFLFTDRDSKILNFLWKWKLASTATIHEAVCRSRSEYSTYKALERLARYKFVKSDFTFEQNFSSWVLSDRGFAAIRASLGDLCEEGYGSEHHWHDRNVVAFQLGEWSTNQLPIVTHFSEQEMRRRSSNYYPAWVPQTKEHRPDGYTRIKTDSNTVVLAYEVEIWPKALSIYESTLRFYQLMKNVDRVYWLIGDQAVKDQILRARDCIRETSKNYHVFVDLAEYQDKGWDAVVTNECSEKLDTVRGIMRRLCGDTYGKYVGDMWGQSRVTVHYDKRKVLGKKRT